MEKTGTAAKASGWLTRYLQRFRENRKTGRRPSAIPVEIWWDTDGGARTMQRGVCIDHSAGGLGIVFPGPAEGREHVHVRLASDGVMKCGQVRYCRDMGGSYLMGLKLADRCGQWKAA